MKKIIVAMTLVTSMSAFATEFTAKMENVTCTIKNNVVTRTESFSKNKVASFTETKQVSLTGVDALIAKAAETSSQTSDGDEYFAYSMIHNGASYTLSTTDSVETMALIRMIARMCR